MEEAFVEVAPHLGEDALQLGADKGQGHMAVVLIKSRKYQSMRNMPCKYELIKPRHGNRCDFTRALISVMFERNQKHAFFCFIISMSILTFKYEQSMILATLECWYFHFPVYLKF